MGSWFMAFHLKDCWGGCAQFNNYRLRLNDPLFPTIALSDNFVTDVGFKQFHCR